ncbi:MAG: NAD(P)H-hydrate dehydratase [Lachnospiraceae bacterium]|nr:NAD(P)H-hydrate dehydratase [Lachnospiraceae bacterium]
MKYLLTAAQMQNLDRHTIDEIGVPSAVLMERAALAIAEEVMALPEIAGKGPAGCRILSVCGTGNNGGDGVACARILRMKGYEARILLIGDEARFSKDMQEQVAIARRLGIPFVTTAEPDDYDAAIDAIFGIGLARPIAEESAFGQAIALIGSLNCPVVAADIPSGINADTGAVMGMAVKARCTVTMQAAKRGHVLYPGRTHTGRLIVADIGIQLPNGIHAAFFENEASGYAVTFEDHDLSLLPARDPNGNKGTFGKILILAGSRNMCGAALLACRAALRAGAGMVRLLTPEANRIIVQETLPEVMLNTYTTTEEALAELSNAAAWADVIAAGPGLGQNETAKALMGTVLSYKDKPRILDADGLNVIDKTQLTEAEGPILITPHPGEMKRLSGLSAQEILADPAATATAFAKETGVVCLLKGGATVIAAPDGRVIFNKTGNSGMATAGSGDVLTGICAGLAARGTNALLTGALGAYLHGKAGDIAAGKLGPSALTAGDLIESMPYALGELT